jgi:uncharacterized membrane protein YkvI
MNFRGEKILPNRNVPVTLGHDFSAVPGRILSASSSRFQRLLLPGFAFKALVIGGGYATGRELATFFLPSGPRGGLWAMLLSALVWSIVCTLTFLFALQTRSRDYGTFFRHLLGPLWPAFEIAYALTLIVVLAVYSAAAGAIGTALFAWSPLVGSLLLMVCVVAVAAYGNSAVERLFQYVTVVVYGTYLLLAILVLSRFGHRSLAMFSADIPSTGWVLGGLTYGGYNIIGAVLILPVVRHMQSRRDAIVSGVLAGPMTILPAVLFFFCLLAFYPQVVNQVLPADYMLQRLNAPALRALFELMVFTALLESATGAIHACNERTAQTYRVAYGRDLPRSARLALTCVVLAVSVFLAARIGLVTLIARGYSWLALAILLIYVLPLITLGTWRLLRKPASAGLLARARF